MNIYDSFQYPQDLFGESKMHLIVPETAFQVALAYRDTNQGIPPGVTKACSRDAGIAYDYALRISRGRFPLGEPAIMTKPWLSYKYARDVLEGMRWPEGEAAIARDGFASMKYAAEILRGRFEIGEPAIKREHWREEYEAWMREFGVEL